MTQYRPATADEALDARDKVMQYIAEREPEVQRLRLVQRELHKSYKAAHLEWVLAAIDLKHAKHRLFALAAGAASGDLVMPEPSQ